jgi:hypothetical protein
MTTIFPAQIDNAISIPVVVDGISTINAASINNLRGAIIAIEQNLGTGAQGVYGTVAARLSALEATIDSIVGNEITISGDIGGSPTLLRVIGLQGNPIANIEPLIDQALVWNGTSWVPEFVEEGQEYVVTLSGASMFVEIDFVLVNPIFNADYSETPISAVFVDNVGNAPLNLFNVPVNYPTDFTPPYNFIYGYPAVPIMYGPSVGNFGTYGSSVTFSLTTTAIETVTATFTITAVQRVYFGASSYNASVSGGTAEFIQSLSNNPLSDTNTCIFTVGAGDNQYIYFAYRSAYGSSDFYTYGWAGGFNLISNSISVTNAQGYTENYTLYQSSQTSLGITNIYVF